MSAGPDHSSPVDEQLSAWLDDELPAAEVALLATRLAASPELRARIARYGLIGSTLRGGQGAAAGFTALQVSARVRTELDTTGMPAAAAGIRRAGSRLPYAAAAGVALLAVTLVSLLGPAEGPGPTTANVMLQPAALPANVPVLRSTALVADRVGSPGQSSLSSRRLTSYLVYHGEYSGALSAKLTDSHIVNNRPYAAAVRTAAQPVVR